MVIVQLFDFNKHPLCVYPPALSQYLNSQPYMTLVNTHGTIMIAISRQEKYRAE